MVPLSGFLSSNQSIYASGSLAYRAATYLVAKPLWWALEQMNVVSGSDGSETSESKWRTLKCSGVVMRLIEVCPLPILQATLQSFLDLSLFAFALSLTPQNAAEAILKHQSNTPQLSFVDKLHNPTSFREEFGSTALPGVTLSDTDVKVLIKYLERDKGILVYILVYYISSMRIFILVCGSEETYINLM
jgi:charged multivesicular body protein 7